MRADNKASLLGPLDRGALEQKEGADGSSLKSPGTRKAPRASILIPFKDATTGDLALLVVALLCAACAGAMLPYFFRSMGGTIDNLSSMKDVSSTVLEMVIAGVASLVLQGTACFCMEVVADRLTARLRCRYVSSVLGQSMAWFDTHDGGSLPSRLDLGLAEVRDGLGMKFVSIPSNIVLIIGALVVACMTEWSITLCSLVGCIPCGIFGSVLGWAMRHTAAKVSKSLEAAGAIAAETFSNFRTVAAFGGEQEACRRYETHIAEAERAGIRGGIYSGLGIGGLLASVFAMFTLVFYLSGRKVVKSFEELLDSLPNNGEDAFTGPPSDWPRPEFKGGSAFVISICLLLCAFTLGAISENIATFLKAIQASAHIQEIVKENSAIDPASEEGDKDVSLEGDIVFDAVTFSYPARPDVTLLRNFSLRIPAGKAVAFVGPSGCGKSTLLHLTQRLYDPAKGRVTIAGRDIKSLNTRWYRSRIGVVMQEPRLFAGTIEENIRLGASSSPLSFAQVEAAAQQAHVATFVSQLPLKYATVCGPGGLSLSGGQKQRVALARALVRSPAVLILDEATSALDTKSERSVQQALDQVIRNLKCTTLIVAHRLTTIQNVDEIIVLDNRNGSTEVVQRGTHEELMQNTNGLYYNLFNSQTAAPQGPQSGADAASPKGVATPADAVTTADGLFAGFEGDDDVLPSISEIAPSASDIAETAVGLKGSTLIAKVTGRAITMKQANKAGLGRAVKMLAPEWLVFLLMVICSALSGASFPLLGMMLGHFLTVLFRPDLEDLKKETNFWSLLLTIYFIVRFPIEILKQFCKEYLASRLSRRLRADLFNSLVHQDVGFFDLPANSTGALGAILSEDVAVVTTAATGNFVGLFHGVFALVVGLSIGFYYSWKLALVLLATFVFSAAAVSLNHKVNAPSMNAAKGVQKKNVGDSASGVFAEAIEGIRVVMAFGLEQHFAARYQQLVEGEISSKLLSAVGFGISWGLSQSVQFFVFGLALWYGGKLSNNGEISSGGVLNTMFPIVFAASGLGMAALYSADAKKSRHGLKEVFRVIDRHSLIDVRDAVSGGGDLLEAYSGTIDYERVCFRYPSRPEQPVYKDLSFTVSPGETVALVGASGSGKSTAVQLLLRFYDLPGAAAVHANGQQTEKEDGAIRLDSVDVRDANLIRLRAIMGLVSQEPVLFNLSIKDNIRYSKPDATQEDIERAARMANAHGFISMLPQGYDTSVGTGGAQLSGGQRQRIAIARALLRDPQIFILDEATSALDAESEREVQATLDSVVSGSKRSTIIIAHRLSTVKTADKIVVLDNTGGEGSKVVEMGSHAQLMKIPNGVYRALVLSATEHE